MTDGSLSKVEVDVERHLLETTVRLSDGTEGLVFSRGPKNSSNVFLYNCHLCGAANLAGERALQTHIAGRKHQRRLEEPVIDSVAFCAPLPRGGANMSIAPGEPVPPGFENEVRRVPELQPFLDSYRAGPTIGLEYVAELSNPMTKEPSYFCLMCDKRGDPRNIIAHITSYNHRLKYLEKHFPTITNQINPYRFNYEARNLMPRLVQSICEAIEEHHGRLTLCVHDSADFHRNRNRILQDIQQDRHFTEKNGPNFTHIIDRNKIEEQLRAGKNPVDGNSGERKFDSDRPNRDNLDEISSSESESPFKQRSPRFMRRDRGRSRSRERFGGKRMRRSNSMSISPPPRPGGSSAIVGRVHRSPPFDKHEPSRKRSSALSMGKSTGDPKSEKYRAMLDDATRALELELKEHEKNPEKHPLYPEEWKTFWNRRYKELQAEKKDPNKYDYKPEWIVFWTKRMKELHLEQVEKKKEEIRQLCGLLNSPADKLDVVDISDEEISPLSVSPVRSETDRRDRHSSSRDHYRDRERSYGHRDYPPDYYHGRDYPPSQRYSVRYMEPAKLPKYEPEPREEEPEDDSPLTVVSVLRLLTALEENLGSLGPKIIDLLAKALALEKVKANSSDEMLLNDDTSVFFETVKEKLKGQLLANVLDSKKIKTAKRAVKNIAAVLHQVTSKPPDKTDEKDAADPFKAKQLKVNVLDRKLIASKLAAALVVQDKTDVSKEDMDRLINVFILIVKLSKERNLHVEVKDILLELGIEPPVAADEDEILSNHSKVESKDSHDTLSVGNNAASSLVSLTDSDLKTLLQNFKHLSSEEQHHLIAHLKKLESTDPIRVEKLRKFVDVTDLKQSKPSSPLPETVSNEASKSNFQDDDFEEKQITTLESDDDEDYNFDDVVKAASNNLKTNSSNRSDDNIGIRSGSVSRDSDRDHSNLSDMSNIRHQIPQNLINNLLGSLQQNFSNTAQNNGGTDNKIPTIGAPLQNNQNLNPNSQAMGRSEFHGQTQALNPRQMNSQFINNQQFQQQQQQQQPVNMFDDSFNSNQNQMVQPQPHQQMFGRRPNNTGPDQFNMGNMQQNMSNLPNNFYNQFQQNPGQQPGNFMNTQNNQRQRPNVFNNVPHNPGGSYY